MNDWTDTVTLIGLTIVTIGALTWFLRRET